MVHFLVVKAGQEFEFAMAPRAGARQGASAASDLARGFDLLKEALKVLGLGAKTAAGYGRFGW